MENIYDIKKGLPVIVTQLLPHEGGFAPYPHEARAVGVTGVVRRVASALGFKNWWIVTHDDGQEAVYNMRELERRVVPDS